MSELVADCPRCGARQITFDVSAANDLGTLYGWKRFFEAFSVCRNCGRASVFSLSQQRPEDGGTLRTVSVGELFPSVNQFMNIDGFVNIGDLATTEPPEHLPPNIEPAFKEGATALAVKCYNAAGTMFRLCVDLATRPKLPEVEVTGLNARVRRDLGLRLPWLFDNKYLPKELRELSVCIKDDGNDGAHAGTLQKADAEDLLDFTVALLERMYTEPERLRIAKERRSGRRSELAKK
jgi:hypothetical protein